VDNLIQRQLADKFGRYQKIERYKRLLQRATEDGQRARLAKLIEAEKRKQKEAGDSQYLY
jgi:hypothetical protein